ncbi:MAG: S8 family serine peptidase [candidate division WOR-3 bacterium]|nr:S8 family serine peptidase [candidate division WOR-3 bacterium]
MNQISSLCDTLRGLFGVEWAHPNLYLLSYVNPNDPMFQQQWSLSRINCSGAWNYDKRSSNVRIGIIDTGVKYDHPDLGGGFGSGFKIAGGYDYIDSDNDPYDPGNGPHGTHVAGIASALTNNNIGIAGISGGWRGSYKGCPLYVFRVATTSHVAQALIRAAKPINQGGYGCRVINLSMRYPYGGLQHPY